MGRARVMSHYHLSEQRNCILKSLDNIVRGIYDLIRPFSGFGQCAFVALVETAASDVISVYALVKYAITCNADRSVCVCVIAETMPVGIISKTVQLTRYSCDLANFSQECWYQLVQSRN